MYTGDVLVHVHVDSKIPSFLISTSISVALGSQVNTPQLGREGKRFRDISVNLP